MLGFVRQNVDFQNLTLAVKGKGNKHRLIPMSIELRKLLFRHLSGHNHELVFCSADGGKLNQRKVLRDFKVMCAKLGLTGSKPLFIVVGIHFRLIICGAGHGDIR